MRHRLVGRDDILAAVARQLRQRGFRHARAQEHDDMVAADVSLGEVRPARAVEPDRLDLRQPRGKRRVSFAGPSAPLCHERIEIYVFAGRDLDAIENRWAASGH